MKKVFVSAMLLFMLVIGFSSKGIEAINYYESKTVTTVPVTINDKGADDNFEKKIYLDEKISWYNDRGADEIKISYTLRIDALDEGTQYVQVFDKDPDYSSSKIHSKSFNRSKSGGYQTYSATVTIDIDKFYQSGNYFYFGFDASGWGDDDWNLDDMSVTVYIEHEVYHVNYDSYADSYYAGDVGNGKTNTMYLNTGYDYDYIEYEISPYKSGAYNVYSESTSSNLDTYGWVYEWQGLIPFDYKEQIGSDDNSGDGNNFRLEFDSLDANENYFVKVRPKYSTHSGSTRIVFEANYDDIYAPTGGIANVVAKEGIFGDDQRYYFNEEATRFLYMIAYRQAHEDIINAYLDHEPIDGGTAIDAAATVIITAVGLASAPVGIVLTIIYFLATFIEENPYAFESVIISANIEQLCGGNTFWVDNNGNTTLDFSVSSGLTIQYGSRFVSQYSPAEAYTEYSSWSNNIMEGETLQRWQFEINE